MEIDRSVGKVALALEVACLDDNLTVADSPNVEDSGCEAEGEVDAAAGSVEVEAALVLDDVCAVALCNEAEGNLIYLADDVFVDEAYGLADGDVFERRDAFERACLAVAFAFCYDVSGSCIGVEEVSERLVDGTGLPHP